LSLNYFRVASAAPELKTADVVFNTDRICELIGDAEQAEVSLLVFPELSVTSYSCGDLFHQHELYNSSTAALRRITAATREKNVICVVGSPVIWASRMYNCALVIGAGNVLAVVPKTFLPNSGEYYEKRWFSSGRDVNNKSVSILGCEVPFGSDLLIRVGGDDGAIVGIEVCEDLWAVSPPSGGLALGGAEIIANLSASNELVGKAAYRRDLVVGQSGRCVAAYVYSSAGPGESSTDVVFGGHCMITENGFLLEEDRGFSFESRMIVADIDIQRLRYDRLKNASFCERNLLDFRIVDVRSRKWRIEGGLKRHVSAHPFVPSDGHMRGAVCEEIFLIQSVGLAKRLRHTGVRRVVLGLSGGLDSALAALVTVRAFDLLKLPRNGIICVSMPGFGTSERTATNAEQLATNLGVTFRLISIQGAVDRHFEDIGYDARQRSVTYENAQARERTQILMDLANDVGGLVVGTGDLSEAALGWCTFNGDHMSMYHVNSGVPKTLVQYLIRWCADSVMSGTVSKTLQDICETPISPELMPVNSSGEISQYTEDLVGPYELHDFFLYHFVRGGSSIAKIRYLAGLAFIGRYGDPEISRWLRVFVRRFFAQQFKRSSMPDGPKVGSVSLSPRGDWRMPSDAEASDWLAGWPA
jgi:NAD+ synthase (glutamine-hydrolysing)